MNKYFLLFYFFSVLLISKGQNYVSTYAGNGTPGLVNGDTASSRFKNPFGMCIDKFANIYIADGGNHCIRKITSSGIVSTLAGTGVLGYLDGAAASAQFNNPTGVCADDSGNVYVADFQNQRIRKISFSGVVTTIAGSGTAGYLDGSALSAQFNYPRGICRDQQGNLYAGDSWNHRIRKISPVGNVSTYAGGGSATGVGSTGAYVDANDTSARFYTPAGLSIDQSGNIFVADAYNHRIRKIDITRMVTTVAGSGSTGSGNGGFANGAVSSALLNTPTELYADSAGKIYIGDTFNNRVRLVSGGYLSTLAGNGITGYINGVDSLAQFNYTRGVVYNSSDGNVYVCDYNNHSIRKIALSDASGISEAVTENDCMVLYPNPNKGAFCIVLKPFDNIYAAIPLNMKIIDSGGKVLYHNDFLSGNLFSLPDFRELPAGIYSVIISSRNFRQALQFIKQ